jgi:hypothetical protein
MSLLQLPISSSHTQKFNDTAEYKVDVRRLEVDLSFSTTVIRRPVPAIQGTVDSFRPLIHQLVPELKNLTTEDLDTISQSNKFDFDDD